MKTVEAFHVPDTTAIELVHWLDYLEKHYACSPQVLIKAANGKPGYALLCASAFVRCGNIQHPTLYVEAVAEHRATSLPQLCRALYDLFFPLNEEIDTGCPKCWEEARLK